MILATSPTPDYTPSDQQRAIVEHQGDLTINAVAGSGKTSTLIQYGAARPHQRLLYLAFNRTVRLEAQQRFAAKGVRNVDVHTAHSLAYRRIMTGSAYQLKPKGEYSAAELVDTFKLKTKHGTIKGAKIAAHVRKLLTWYCNAEVPNMGQLDYLSQTDVDDRKQYTFVERHLPHITRYAQDLYTAMDEARLPVTHDYYLKAFQLRSPKLAYDTILFDEGQDASATMLATFMQQSATKVIVGDEHQQIYGFRHAVNSLAKTGFARLPLTQSFRFGSDVARLANRVLDWKQELGCPPHLPVEGLGTYRQAQNVQRAVIGRTNLSVLAAAIEDVCIRQAVSAHYFEGNFETYTYMDQGGSLFDVLNVFAGRLSQVKNPLFRELGDIEALMEYAEEVGESTLKLAIKLVTTYQLELPHYIEQIREAQLDEAHRQWADRCYSTVHRCKGLEYDEVVVQDDFITLEGLQKQIDKLALAPPIQQVRRSNQLAEEINMLYVAVTRSKCHLALSAELQSMMHAL